MRILQLLYSVVASACGLMHVQQRAPSDTPDGGSPNGRSGSWRQYLLSGLPKVPRVGEPPVQLGQLLQHVHQQAEAGSLLQVESPAGRQDLLQKKKKKKKYWTWWCVGIWRVGHKDRTFPKEPREALKCPAQLWTQNPGKLAFQINCNLPGQTNLPAFLPPRPVSDQVKQNGNGERSKSRSFKTEGTCYEHGSVCR